MSRGGIYYTRAYLSTAETQSFSVADLQVPLLQKARLSNDLLHALELLDERHPGQSLHVHGEEEVLSDGELVVVGGDQLTDVTSVDDKPVAHLVKGNAVDEDFTLSVRNVPA